MRAFACGTCRSLVFFESSSCVTCGSLLGFVRDRADLVVLATDEHGAFFGAGKATLRSCGNRVLARCNWLAEESAPGGLCSCCRLTRTRPADDDVDGLGSFVRTEEAKRRLVAQLDHLGLPTTSRAEDPRHGLAFDLLSSARGDARTGHDNGVITIDLAEGDDGYRENLRNQLAEPYRTLLGNLRHEIGHWYWAELVDATAFLDRFRDLFGDERADYAAALAAHYSATVPSGGWADAHVSRYAAAHPWEDWAETFAHYLHIRETTQTAAAWGLRIEGPDLDLSLAWDAGLSVTPTDDVDTFDELVHAWVPMALALNAVNRSMGKDDLYPFVLRSRVLDKLRFVHNVVSSQR